MGTKKESCGGIKCNHNYGYQKRKVGGRVVNECSALEKKERTTVLSNDAYSLQTAISRWLYATTVGSNSAFSIMCLYIPYGFLPTSGP